MVPLKSHLPLLVVVLMSAACGVPQKQHADLQSQLELEQKKSAELEQQLNQTAQTKEQLEQKTQTYQNLLQSLEKEIQDGKVTISQMQDKLTVNLVDRILFDSGKKEIKAEGKVALEKVADVFRDIDNKQIQINGHTDNKPIRGKLKQQYPSNWELSTARATAVVKFLAEKQIPEERMSAAGYAEYRPVAENTTEEGRQKNRRIEIVLLPKQVEEVPLKIQPKESPASAPTGQ